VLHTKVITSYWTTQDNDLNERVTLIPFKQFNLDDLNGLEMAP
jgi:hypothetical protein